MKCTECEDGRWFDASHGCSRRCKSCDGTGLVADEAVEQPEMVSRAAVVQVLKKERDRYGDSRFEALTDAIIFVEALK